MGASFLAFPIFLERSFLFRFLSFPGKHDGHVDEFYFLSLFSSFGAR